MSMSSEWIDRQKMTIGLPTLMVAMALVLRAFSFSSAGLDWDESLYIVISQRWLAGGVPYVAVWDQHPMGLPAIFMGAMWLIGDGLLAVRAAAFLAVTGTAVLLGYALIRFARAPWAGVLAGVLYLFYMSRPEGLAANTEVFNNFIVTLASLMMFSRIHGPDRSLSDLGMLGVGLLFGIGLQVKYVVIPEAIILCLATLIYDQYRTRNFYRTARLATVTMLGGILPTVLMTLYFWQAGALRPYLDANLRANITYLTVPASAAMTLLRLRYGLLPLIGLLPWPAVFLWLLRQREVRQKYGMLAVGLALWILAAAIDVALPMKLWKHYFNALIPPLCLMTGLTIVLLARCATTLRPVLATALIALTLAPAIGSIVKHVGDSRSLDRINVPLAIATAIRDGGTDGHDVYVFNYDALVYAYAHATPPTRYVLGIDLAEFHNLSGVQPAMEIGRILAEKPRWIVVADPSPYIYPQAVWDEITPTLKQYAFVAAYREVDYIQPPITVRLYRRQG